MAYDKKEILKISLEAIEKHKLFFIEDIVSYIPCGKTTFYDMNLNEANEIKEALLKVRTDLKVSMRSKWYKSTAPALQMALMKLIATPTELKKLSMSYVESENKNTNIEQPLLPDVSTNDSSK